MQTSSEVSGLVAAYLSRNPAQQERTNPILLFLQQFDGDDLYVRTNFTGHITGSVYILNQSGTHLLLLEHKFLKRWLQPGGHVEVSDENIQAAARREALEETGIKPDQLKASSTEIFDIDSHPIPENSKKQEPAHVHHDVTFLFVYDGPADIQIDVEESTAAKWIAVDELENDAIFSKVFARLKNYSAAG